MIIIGEQDKNVRKKLCDLLSRERIIGVDSTTSVLEKLCIFKNNIDLAIVNINFLNEPFNQAISKICLKLEIKEPPLLGYYKEGEESLKESLEQTHRTLILLKYDEHDQDFPIRYINLVKRLCPHLNASVEKAKEMWLKKDDAVTSIDYGEWLKAEGFVVLAEKKGPLDYRKNVDDIIPSIENLLVEEIVDIEDKKGGTAQDYEKVYSEIKQRYEELSMRVKELLDFVKNLK